VIVNLRKEGAEKIYKKLAFNSVRVFRAEKKNPFFIHLEEGKNEKISNGPDYSQLGTDVG
jgi:hypothetical protein